MGHAAPSTRPQRTSSFGDGRRYGWDHVHGLFAPITFFSVLKEPRVGRFRPSYKESDLNFPFCRFVLAVSDSRWLLAVHGCSHGTSWVCARGDFPTQGSDWTALLDQENR